MNDRTLQDLVAAFNRREFAAAAGHSAEGLLRAEGRSEAFWVGLNDTCEGYCHLKAGDLDRAEQRLVAAMQKLRNFGYTYENLEITRLLAGVRRSLEEIRAVRAQAKRVYDVSLFPQLTLSVQAQQMS